MKEMIINQLNSHSVKIYINNIIINTPTTNNFVSNIFIFQKVNIFVC